MSRPRTPPRRPRRLVAYLATSADGYIARRDGGVEWLDRPTLPGDYGMGAFLRSIDTIVYGRKTYDQALRFERQGKGGPFDPRLRHWVFTHRRPRHAPPGVEFVSGSVKRFARRLRAEPGRDVWLMGGAGLYAAFLDAREVDELVLHVVPTLIGDGIPLLAPRRRSVELELLSSRRFSDGVVRLRYGVARPTPQQRGAVVRVPRRRGAPRGRKRAA